MQSVGMFWKRSLALFLCLLMTFQLIGTALATEMESESEDEYGFTESPGEELSLLEEGSGGEDPREIDPVMISGEMEDLREESYKLNNRDGSNAIYEMIILDVMKAYCYDITKGCQLYYTPAAMTPPGSTPSDWTFSYIEEVIISGVDSYYEGRFYRYR